MNKIIFRSVVLMSSLVATQTFAQFRKPSLSAVDNLKQTRKEMEVKTENQILEKLESARLEDEKNRRAKFESLNFSVVNDESTTKNNF